MKKLFWIWAPFVIVVSMVAGLSYLLVQQTLRGDANSPQIQMAEDAAVRLATGEKPELVAAGPTVDIAQSLAPYLLITDQNAKPLYGTARLRGVAPTVPSGVLAYARQSGEYVLTWQPEPGVRQALVVVPRTDTPGYVIAGRSLRVVEAREHNVLLLTFFVWIFGLLLTLLSSIIQVRLVTK